MWREPNLPTPRQRFRLGRLGWLCRRKPKEGNRSRPSGGLDGGSPKKGQVLPGLSLFSASAQAQGAAASWWFGLTTTCCHVGHVKDP
jgi:hypothetical protein